MLQWIYTNQRRLLKTAASAMVLLSAVFCLFAFTSSAWAQSVADPSSTLQEGVTIIQKPLGLPSTDIRLIVANIIRIALGLLGIIALGLIIYAGFLWMTSGGNEEQVGKAKKILTNAIIGLIIILAAYSIVLFIMRMLGIGAGQGQGGAVTAPATQNFIGSGALGRIVKDHYPMRDQTDVARNTKIAVTFRRPVLASSFIQDVNGDGIYGNCSAPPAGGSFDWVSLCDRVIMDDDHINIRPVNSSSIAAAAILAPTTTDPVSQITGVYTIVIKPLTDLNVHPSGGYLGSDAATVQYSVRLGREIRIDDSRNSNPSAFQSSAVGNNYYEWKFTTGLNLDLSPPTVTSVFPRNRASEPRNSVMQINFSEPVDPYGIQGEFVSDTAEGVFYVRGGFVFLQTANSTRPTGSFLLANGYRTLEFTPSTACGLNACGGAIYCLPSCDAITPHCQVDNYKMLLKAGRTLNQSSFEAIPLSGFMDMAGNALDGNANKAVDLATTSLPVFDRQRVPDNYYWDFKIKNGIDKESPYIISIKPEIDGQNVVKDVEWSMNFSKIMRVDPLYDIFIEEYPSQTTPLWKAPRAEMTTTTTYVKMSHGSFIDDKRQYYFPVVPSSVEDVHFNCLYPGIGPRLGGAPLQTLECDGSSANCCPVSTTTLGQALCCNSSVSVSQSTTAACINYLKGSSPL